MFWSPGIVAQQSHIWFLDRSLYWHYLTPTFTSYYRLMLTHLGLPEWQYSFTPYGASPQAKVRDPSDNDRILECIRLFFSSFFLKCIFKALDIGKISIILNYYWQMIIAIMFIFVLSV